MDHHQSDLADSVAPIVRAVGRRHAWTAVAVIERWIAESARRSCEEPAAGTFLLDDACEGPIREDDDAAHLDCGIVGHRDLHVAPCWLKSAGTICNLAAKPNLILNPNEGS